MLNEQEGGAELEHQQQQPFPDAAPQAHQAVHAEQPPQQLKPADAGTVRWFQENANEKPFEGARYNVMQIIFAALTILAEHSVHQVVFNQFMKLMSEVLPEGNHWPRYKYCASKMNCPDSLCTALLVPYNKPQQYHIRRTYYICVKACGTADPRRFEHHMCPNKHCCRPYPELPRDEWRQHMNDYCDHCGEKRFKIVCGEPHPRKR
jgi:hypothetical protein